MNSLSIYSTLDMKKLTTFSIGQKMKFSFVLLFACTLFNLQAFASENTILDLDVSLTVYDAECGNANDGAITSIVSGGVPPYTYEWSNGETTAGVVDLAPGSYTLTVTDAAQNAVSASGTVGQEDSDMTLDLNASYETCEGSCDGNVSVNVDGGNGSHTYLWNTGDDFVVVYNACAGLYTVTVTDEDGCSVVGSIELELSPEGIWLMISGTDATCASSNDGTAHVSVMTGEAPYTIEWSDGQMGEDVTGLSAGTYTVTVTDANGCFNTDEITIEAGSSNIELDLNASYETCDGSCDGNVSVNASGGSGGFTYLWNTGDDFVVVDNACAGTYSVTVTDDAGCSATGSIDLELSPEGVWLMTTSTDVTCNGGSDGTAYVSVMSGEAPYDITWNTTPPQTGADAIGLSAGIYTVTAVDANGCSNSEEVTIGEPSAIVIVVDNTEDAGCNTNDGSISISVSGGTPGYTYEWSNGATTQDIENLAAGAYTVTVTDDSGCTEVMGPININGSSDIIITVDDVNDATCGLDNGSINISVSGGTPGYSFEWSNGANTEDLANIGAGSYTVTVTDSNGCSAVNGPIVVNESSEIVITIDDVNDSECGLNNGSINISVSGGTPGYTFDWSNSATTEDIENLSPGGYSVTVTDANGCTAVMGPITVDEEPCCDEPPVIQSVVVIETPCGSDAGIATIEMVGNNADYSYTWTPNVGTANNDGNSRTGLPAGEYTVVIATLSDPNCPTITEEFTVGISDFPDVTVVSSIPANCDASDGSVEMSEPSFEYLWCNGATGYNPTNLPAGMCVVQITDPSTGCTDFQTIIIDEENNLTATYTVNNYPDCGIANGSVTIVPDGGSGNYDYTWNPNVSSSATADNLSSGSYSVTISDDEGCETIISFILIDNVPGGATVSIEEPIRTTCVGSADATVVYDVTYDADFVQPPSIEIVNANGVTQTNGNLSGGDYCIIIRDGNGCLAAMGCFEVTEPAQIDMDIAINDECPSPSITIVETLGGTAPYTYDWAHIPGSPNTQNLTNLEAGTYSVTVTDANGCTAAADNLPITSTCVDCPAVDVQSVVVVETPCGSDAGIATIEMVGNNADFSFTWTPDVGTPNGLGNSRANLPAGLYSVVIATLSDPDCPTTTEEFTVGVSDFPEVTVVSSTPATCGASDGSIEMSEPSFEYLWCNGATGHNPTNLPAGMCVVQITDPSTGCIDYQTVVIEEINNLNATYTVNNYPDCGIANGSVTITPTGVGPFSYEWSPNTTTTTATANSLASGVYTVTITDDGSNGCQTEITFVLLDNVPGGAMVSIEEPISTSCIGSGDATVVFDVTYDADFVQPASVEIVDANGFVQTNGNLSGGDYCIIVRDGDGCLAAQGCFEVIEPAQIDMDLAINDECPSPSITIVETLGGTAPYTYDWFHIPGSPNDQNLTDLEAGTYSVTVTDVNGCTAAANNLPITSVCIDCPDINIQSVVVVETACMLSEGIANIEMVGDNANYSYDWSPDVGTPNGIGNSRTGLPSGIYEVTITDLSEPTCDGIIEIFSVGISDFPLVTLLSTTPATCNESNGTAVMSEINFDYLWCNGETGNNPTNLPAGPCVVEITDPATGCTDYQTVVIESFNPLMLDVVVNNEPDCGLANGSVTINVTGGSTDYSYEWSNGGSTQTLDNISSGLYCVTITDNGPTGCVKDTCFVLTDNISCASIVIAGPVSTSCIGSNDGTVDFTTSYDPCFALPATTQILDSNGDEVTNGSLAPGNYCIVEIDANGCINATACFEVTEPTQIDMDLAINNNCDPTPGIEIVETVGGTTPYTYDWADLPGSDNPEDRPDLETGSYGVTVTDANGCTAGIDNLMVIDTCACPPMIISSVVVVESNCGEATGQATVTVVDAATNNYTYDWSPNVGNGASVTGLPAGVYSVTITNVDQPQCNLVEQFSVGNTNGPQVEVETTPSLCGSSSGSTTFSNATYSYEWSDPTIGTTTNIINDIPSGTYFVTITDPANPDCNNIITVVVEEEPSFSLAYTVNSLPDCGLANGSVTVDASPSGDYSYSWGNSPFVDNLTSGAYTVTVTDNINGCTSSISFVLTDNVTNTVLTINAEAFVSCPGTTDGFIDYSVDPGVTVEIQDMDGNIYNNNELAPGAYCLIATNMDGCVSGGECLEVRSPSQIDVDVAIFDEECGEPGEIQLVEVIGGAGNYEYAWSPNTTTTDSVATNLETGQYTFTVTDANGCTVSETVFVADDPFALAILITGDSTICGTPNELSAGTIGDTFEWTNEAGEVIGMESTIMIDTIGVFYVEVTNGNCTDMDSIIVTPGEFELSIADVDVCFGESDILNPGGNTDYMYEWSPADVLDDPNAPSPMVTTNMDTEFSVTVTDVLGVCQDTLMVQYNVEDEIDLAIESEGTELCSGDLTTLTAVSNNGETFEWFDDLGGTPLCTGVTCDVVPGTYLAPVTYYVVATLNGCTTIDSISVTDYSVSFEISGPANACEGDIVMLSPEFGLDVFLDGATYDWTGPGIIEVLATGEVMVTATAGDGDYNLIINNTFCEGSSDFSLQVSDFSDANATAEPEEIFLSETSQLNITENDGWTYEWEDDISFLDPTTIVDPEVQPEITTDYFVTITDGNGCVDTRTVTVVVDLPECEEPFIFFPNAFSPNGDGNNDVLFLRGQDVTEVFFAIYDRWGEKVFESNSQSEGWDGTFKGKELGNDVYGFYLRVRCGNGDEFYKQGNVSLFR